MEHIILVVEVILRDSIIQEMIDLQYPNQERQLHSVQSGQIHIPTREIHNISVLSVLLQMLDMGGIQRTAILSKLILCETSKCVLGLGCLT